MLKEMTTYLNAEKQESLLFILVGLLAIGVAAWLWMNGHRLKSMAFPLVTVALIQIVVGGSVFLRTESQIAALSQQWTTAPAQYKAEESQRMEVVMKNFRTYKMLEIALLVVGVLLIAFLQKSDVAVGIGTGLILQSALMLCLDLFAVARGSDYVIALQTFAN